MQLLNIQKYKKILCALLIILTPQLSFADECTTYERETFKMIDEAMSFINQKEFATFGWSPAGITNDWVGRWKLLYSDRENALKFTRKYGFQLGNVYSVVSVYREKGSLNGYWQEVEDDINSAKPCEYL